jgi:hypothetical protein
MKTMRWAQKTREERLSHIGQFIAITPTLRDAIAAVRSIYGAWRTKPEGTCLFLVGEPRIGKTTAIDEFIFELHEHCCAEYDGREGYVVTGLEAFTASMAITVETPTGYERPLVKVLVGSRPTFNDLLADVLLCLGIVVPKAATFGERLQILKTQLIGQKVRMIVFDEVQHISEHRGTEGAYKAADVFKVLMKAPRVQLVCAGLPHAVEIIDANPQVARLTQRICHMHPFKLDLEPNSELMIFMQTLNAQLPFDKPSMMADADLALRVALYSDCIAGRIALLTHTAVDHAIETHRDCMNVDVLAKVVRERYCIRDEENVFLMSRDALGSYPQLVRGRRQERIRAAENRQSLHARHKRKRKAFGARGQ